MKHHSLTNQNPKTIIKSQNVVYISTTIKRNNKNDKICKANDSYRYTALKASILHFAGNYNIVRILLKIYVDISI